MYQEATTKTRIALNLKGNKKDGRQNDEQITIFFSFVQFKTNIRNMHVAFKLSNDQMTVSHICHCKHFYWIVSLTENCLSKTQQLFSSNG